MFYEQETDKYTCPITGAHFRAQDLSFRLEKLYRLRHHSEQISSANLKTVVPRFCAGVFSEDGSVPNQKESG